ncbi:MAG: endonuclease [Candidatus Krumholzibacteria bacterium]|jgi:endonuclease I|nr:endonuclease [Candidatus Krumholzibacteria bacterium]MDP6668937.1 endonuclease [Candidatus Krumholzibacteria bacterium]MDP6797602.1 endonuclease [Candidatus Krumholzibacteria bacterium]MDP7022259.1 endonuclease [Candidatus Krumholzibacteria bacterium]
MRTSIVAALLLLSLSALADPPAGYYDSVDLTSSETLRNSLHAIIDGHTKIPYTSSSTDTWDVLKRADEDPFNSGRILDVYRNRTFTKYNGGNNFYNREHSWPNSYGFPDDNYSNKPYSDCHHLFLCDIGYNSDRGSRIFDNCESGCSILATDDYNGQSGENRTKNGYPNGIWETWDARKGDIARAQFYMDVRYEGDGSEPDLILVDDPNLIASCQTGDNEDIGYMGLLTVLLEWHEADPVDDRERNRNDWIYTYQHNRNPFIDHPDWVEGVYLGIVDAGESSPASDFRIVGAWPNPFNPSTEIAIALPEAGRVKAEILTVDGRKIRSLLDEDREAGTISLHWDGRNDLGEVLPSGAYLCRIESGKEVDAHRLLLIK